MPKSTFKKDVLQAVAQLGGASHAVLAGTHLCAHARGDGDCNIAHAPYGSLQRVDLDKSCKGDNCGACEAGCTLFVPRKKALQIIENAVA